MRANPNYINSSVIALNQTQLTEQNLTIELSSGSRVNQLSDDPVAAAQNILLRDRISADDTFTSNASQAESMLQVADSALGLVVTGLTTALSVATEAANGTLSDTNVSASITELEGLRDQIISLANTTYNGKYVFGGGVTSTSPFALDESTDPATVVYSGDSSVRTLTTPNGSSISLNVPGDQIFTNSDTNVLGIVNQLISDLSSGTDTSTLGDDVTALTGGLNFVNQKRALIDQSINRVESESSAASAEQVQLLSQQTNLMQADAATIATQLSTAKTQESALSSVISALESGSLFDYLK